MELMCRCLGGQGHFCASRLLHSHIQAEGVAHVAEVQVARWQGTLWGLMLGEYFSLCCHPELLGELVVEVFLLWSEGARLYFSVA